MSLKIGAYDVDSIVEPTSSMVWADLILADFQRVISRYMQDISTYLSCITERVLRTTFMQKSKPKYACLSGKIVEVWIDRFCVRFDWWRHQCPQCDLWVRDLQMSSRDLVARYDNSSNGHLATCPSGAEALSSGAVVARPQWRVKSSDYRARVTV